MCLRSPVTYLNCREPPTIQQSQMSTTLIPGLTFASRSAEPGSNIRTSLPSGGQLLLVTDDLVSPADFLLHGAVSLFLKENKAGRIVVVSSLDENHWKTVSQKTGLNLAPHITSKTFELLDPSNLLEGQLDVEGPLKRLHEEISRRVSRKPNQPPAAQFLILDDISILDWISTDSSAVIRFLRAIKHLSISTNTGVIIRYHTTSPNQLSPVFQHLIEACHYHVYVSSLTSGRSGAVSGEVSFSAGPILADKHFVGRSKAKALHYRVDASGYKFFDRGTGGV